MDRCRICLDEGPQTLISPCYCTGTMAFVHPSCLQKWVDTRHTGKCEICGYTYKATASFPPLSDWFLNRNDRTNFRRQFSDIVCFLLLTPMVLACAFMTVHSAVILFRRSDMRWEVTLLLCLSSLLVAVYTIWCAVITRHHILSWRQWRVSRTIYRLQLNMEDSQPQPNVPETLQLQITSVI